MIASIYKSELISRRSLLGGATGLAALSTAESVREVSAAEFGWKLLGEGDGPTGRWDHSIAYDEGSKRLFVFGGRDANFAALGVPGCTVYENDPGNKSKRPDLTPDSVRP